MTIGASQPLNRAFGRSRNGAPRPDETSTVRGVWRRRTGAPSALAVVLSTDRSIFERLGESAARASDRRRQDDRKERLPWALIFAFKRRAIERKLQAEATSGVIKRAPEVMLGVQPQVPTITDRRHLIPVLGLREYWYPAIEARRIGKKPTYWRMLGDEICFFRTRDGGVGAISDVCPHRGASISQGICVFEGTVSCPYHGATFDESGECKAFLGEGPASEMAGKMRLRTYPIQILRG
jgi:nitrite reductase/ring-hydroxylating ferredoxin subunit